MNAPRRRVERRHIEVFLAVVDRGNFSRAARELGVSSSAISQSLRQLEHTIGTELFIRSVRPLTLTDAGKAAEPHARRSLQALEAFIETAAERTGTLTGKLTICTIPTQTTHPVSRLVGMFRTLHPKVRVDIVEPQTRSVDDVSAVVRDGLADVGHTELPAMQHGLRTVEFRPQVFVAVLPPGSSHVGDTIDAETFVRQGLIIGPYFQTSVAYRTLKRMFPDIDAHIAIRTDHRESFPYLVAQGQGVTLVDRANTASALELGCRIVEFKPALRRRNGLVYSKRYLGPVASAFVSLCRSEMT